MGTDVLREKYTGGGGRLAPPAPTSCGSPVIAVGDVRLSHGCGDNGLFQEPAKDEAAATRSAPIEAVEVTQVSLVAGHDYPRTVHPPSGKGGLYSLPIGED